MATSKLPASWSNKNKTEWLERAAYEALSRALNRAVADTGVNFSIWSAGRSKAEQERLFKLAYTRTSRGRKYTTDRAYQGSIWALKSGHLPVASPDYVGGSVGTHRQGRAVDIHPAAIQNWFKSNGSLYGWSWDSGRKLGENHHFEYESGLDQMKHEGPLDHAAVQRVVGATVDGKIGTGTVEKIKAWQKARGLSADGKVGAGTKKAMGLSGKGDAAPAPVIPVGPVGGASVPAPRPQAVEYTLERHQTKNLRPGRVDTKRGLKGELKAITLHHWGSDGQKFDNVVDWLVADGNGNDHSSAHEVIEGGRVAVLASIEDGTWNTGSPQGNLDNYGLECRPEADEETVRTVAARVAAARAEAGWRVPIDLHKDYTNTACPGRYEALRDTIDRLADGEDIPVAITATTPETPAPHVGLPTGKDLLVKLQDVPDFPLLRTPGNLCYYGGDAQMTAVSGKMPNSLVPGEITGTGLKSGAEGLKTWQRQMNARGYSLTVDGRYGDSVEEAAKNLQRLAGLTTDGKIGPTTWFAAFLLPVVS